MLKHFSELVVVNRTKGLIRGSVDITFARQAADSPTHTPDGNPILYIEEPEDDQRHIALGKFMDAWSSLEIPIGTLLAKATGTERENIAVLMNALGTRGQLDVISVLGRVGLDDAAAVELTDILERVKTSNTRRNHIVHGRWILEARLYNANGRVLMRLEQKRLYDVSNPEMSGVSTNETD